MDWLLEATNHLGKWIWDTNTFDKQTCRLWKAFEIPAGAKISHATLLITVDNGYTLFLDGQEIGRGSDWRTVTEYDVTQLLAPGRHTVAVEGFNDRLEGGLIFGLEIQLADQRVVEVLSDDTWSVVPTRCAIGPAEKPRCRTGIAPLSSVPCIIIHGKTGRLVSPSGCRCARLSCISGRPAGSNWHW